MRFVAVLVGSFILLMLAVLGPDPGAGQAIDPAERAWAVVRDTKDVAELEAFVRRFGDSFYTDLARLRIDDLKASGSSCGGVTAEKLASRAAGPLSAAEECALKSKDVFKECAQCPEMVVVPAGSFTMGSPDSEAGRVGDEGPQHTVTFARAFAAGRFAVTFDEWDACIADGGCNHFRPSDQGLGRGRRSVPEVSWNDAQSYVAWLSRKTGKTYRLLSEAEREYVTRAGTTTPFWWCASISTQQASIYTYGYGPNIAPRKQTVPVDSLQPNPWGLHQVHGDAWEWTEDCYHDSYAGAPSDGSAWTAGDCRQRVLRGGSWNGYRAPPRAANRFGAAPGSRFVVDFGFRVGRTQQGAAGSPQ
jgi:formylglycine-generating enzyme required for sulfatase activity